MEKVSIILPVYNAEATLERCIKSVINQKYKNIELIVVNDGSQDNSMNIIKKFIDIDERIKLIDKSNEGVSKARNDGIKAANGKYIQFVDADDILNENITLELVQTLEEKMVDLAFCGYEIKYLDSKDIKYCGVDKVYYGRPDELLDHLFNQSLLFMIWNKLYKKELIKKMFNVNLSLGEDAIFNLDYLQSCAKVGSINLPLYSYQLSRNNGLHLKFSIDDFNTDILLYKKMKELAPNSSVSENIYIDSVQRTIQRMLFTSPIPKKEKNQLIKKAIDNKYMTYALNNHNFEDKQHLYFIYLFRKKWIYLITSTMKVKKCILMLLRK